jgi:hypothetical protein
VPPELPDLYQLDLWLNPPGFLKAARLPARIRLRSGDGNRSRRAATAMSCSRKRCTSSRSRCSGNIAWTRPINSQNQITRIKTTVSEPALGDFNIEHESTNQTAFGNIKWPTAWHSHHGWDDNWQFYRQSTGHNGYGGNFPNVQPNVCGDAVPVPSSIAQAGEDEQRERGHERQACRRCLHARWWAGEQLHGGVQRLRRGVRGAGQRGAKSCGHRRGGDAGAKQADSLAVSSHPHFDHIGGLRTYLHIGATIVAHAKNIPFLNSDVLNYEPRTVNPDIVSRWPPTELSEGYNYEAVQENYVITDNRRILRVYYVQPLQHVEGMLMAYLPAERIAFQADLFDTHEPPRAAQLPAMRSLANQVARMKLVVDTLAPVHGKPVPWKTFESALTSLSGSTTGAAR